MDFNRRRPTRQLYIDIHNKLEDPASRASTELKAAVHADLSANEEIIQRAVQPNGYVRWLLKHLQEEKAKFQASSPAEHDYDGKREKPLCIDCPDPYCDIKKAKVPLVVREAESFEKGVRRFRERHEGNPVVLDEGFETYLEEVESKATQVLRRNQIALNQHVHPHRVKEYAEMDPDELAERIAAQADEKGLAGD